MEKRQSVVVVTGASSGIGNACATVLAKKGERVYGACRAPASYARKADEFFELVAMDLLDGNSINKAAEKILAAEGRVDALICCAGSGLVGSVEDVGLDEAEALMDLNFFGTLTDHQGLPAAECAKRGRAGSSSSGPSRPSQPDPSRASIRRASRPSRPSPSPCAWKSRPSASRWASYSSDPSAPPSARGAG